jgi:hypothetical protein
VTDSAFHAARRDDGLYYVLRRDGSVASIHDRESDALAWIATVTPPKGSIRNPLTEADLPFRVEDGGCYWIKLGSMEPQQLPFSPPGSVIAVEVRRV